jgi:hypothetical protein
MVSVLRSFLLTLRTLARSRAVRHLEILGVRHQRDVLQRTRPPRVRLAKTDRCLWARLARVWAGWRASLVIVKPETVIAWHRKGLRLWWTWQRRRRNGRPMVPADIRTLIPAMAEAHPWWGAPRIQGELLKLGIDVSRATVATSMGRRLMHQHLAESVDMVACGAITDMRSNSCAMAGRAEWMRGWTMLRPSWRASEDLALEQFIVPVLRVRASDTGPYVANASYPLSSRIKAISSRSTGIPF